MDAVTVAVVTRRVEAEFIVGLLRAQGIRAAFSADDVGGQEPQFQIDGLRIVVGASVEELARRLIADDA